MYYVGMSGRPQEVGLPAYLDPLLTVAQAAELTQYSDQTIARAIKDGELRATVGHRFPRIPLSALADWLGLEVDDLRSRCSALNVVAVA